MLDKLPITGDFSNAEVSENLGLSSAKNRPDRRKPPKYQIQPHPGFEIVKVPSGKLAKLAYERLYPAKTPDIEIELKLIGEYEALMYKHIKSGAGGKKTAAQKKLKFHYKRAIAIMTPHLASGWNRWSDNMLDLFLNERTHKVIWGSGNCGKSQVMAILLYIKWRINPTERMVIIASRIVAEAEARVIGYILDIHASAPPSMYAEFTISNSTKEKGVFCLIYDEKEGKYIKNYQACIVSLPIKVTTTKTEVGKEVGANLMGRHPKDRLIIAFDEGQEIPGQILDERIFHNFYTNDRLDIYAWGNPNPVEFHMPETHDMLFRLGASKLSLGSLKAKRAKADKTSVWKWGDTIVLHLAMTDSPKDDPDEKEYYIVQPNGQKVHRLFFLAGKSTVERIAKNSTPNSPAWYSQVLGFPYLYTDYAKNSGVLSPPMIKESRKYPLMWKDSEASLHYFMGVDPSVSGKHDEAEIVVGRMGLMMDNRIGVDLMKGEGCVQAKLTDDQDFTDSIIESMWSLCQKYNIPLDRIGIETHGTGEVIRYAIQGHIERGGKWNRAIDDGKTFHIINPTQAPTERSLFKILGNFLPANEMVATYSTELWVAVRCLVLNRQGFNFPEYILQQFYNRNLETVTNSTKYRIESKKQMRARGIVSPNGADALCNMFEVMRRHGFKYKFYNSGGYNSFFGPQYDEKQRKKKIQERMGSVSQILGIPANFISGWPQEPWEKKKGGNTKRKVGVQPL